MEPARRSSRELRHGSRSWPSRCRANCPAIGAEVVNAVGNEMAHSVGDFLIRRTSLSWRSPVEAEAAASAVARIMAAELGWDRARETAEVASFTHEQQSRPVVA